MKPARSSGLELAAPFRRLLLVLDAMSGVASAAAAVRLARCFEAEFAALYVESEDLIRLAGNPAARLVGSKPDADPGEATPARLDSESMIRTFQARAGEIRRAVERAARASALSASFEVRRGRIAAEVAASAIETDLVVIAWAEHGAWPGPISTARAAEAIARANPGSILFLRGERALAGPVIVAFDGGAAAERALRAGTAIASAAGSPCEVILTTARIAEADRWRSDIRERVAGSGVEIEFLHLPGGDADALCAAARRRGAALVVLGVDGAADGRPGDLLDRLPCSLLLVR